MMKAFLYATAVIVGVSLSFQACPLAAQSVANAQIQGEVTDSSGAAVAKAEIKAIQTNTQLVKTTVSREDGTSFSSIFPSARTGLK